MGLSPLAKVLNTNNNRGGEFVLIKEEETIMKNCQNLEKACGFLIFKLI
jgi:hypothetical protein